MIINGKGRIRFYCPVCGTTWEPRSNVYEGRQCHVLFPHGRRGTCDGRLLKEVCSSNET